MQGNKLCGVISNSTLIFFCAVRSDTKLTEGGSNKLMNCSASHMFVSRGLHVPIAPVLDTLCYNYASYYMHFELVQNLYMDVIFRNKVD